MKTQEESIIKRRDVYIERIKPFMHKSIIKVMIGQRRVGKSYVLLQLIEIIKQENSDTNIIYINMEDLKFSSITNAIELNDYIISQQKKGKRNYIFIDEVQEIHGFEKTLRSLLLDKDNDIYITGSNANILSSELATFLSGRYVEFNIYSLSYSEFLMFHNLENNDDSFQKFSIYGGLPYLIHLNLEDKIVFEYIKSIYNTIIYRDIINRYKIRNTVFLEQLLSFISDNIGSLFSAKKISDYLKSQNVNINTNQVLSYIDYFSSAFILNKVGRYDIIGKRIFEIGDKYYFENLGIRNSIVGYKLQDRAKVLENIVYNHLLFKGYKVKVGVLDTQEIDFVCEKDNEKLYVQVSLNIQEEKTIEREFGNLQKIQDNYPKIVVSQDEFIGNSFNGIKHFNIKNFLLELSL